MKVIGNDLKLGIWNPVGNPNAQILRKDGLVVIGPLQFRNRDSLDGYAADIFATT